MNDKSQKACDQLNDITNTWTLDFAVEAFLLYFADKHWLWDEIIERAIDFEKSIDSKNP